MSSKKFSCIISHILYVIACISVILCNVFCVLKPFLNFKIIFLKKKSWVQFPH